MINKLFKNNFFLLLFFLILGGGVSLLTRYDLLWDFANYHYYNPWAFLNNRWMYDIIPAGVNTFFNPLPDIPLYLLIKFFNDKPDVIIFIQGFWSGAAAFMFLKLVILFFDKDSWLGKLQILVAWLIGVSSWPFFMQIGSSTNEMMMALMVIGSYYLIFKELKNEDELNHKVFLWAGICLGAAAGLKLTAAIYCVSSGIAMILCCRYFKPFKKIILFFILGGIVGFLLTYGFWMWRLWSTFENPVFPLLNNIFRSEWFDIRSYRDEFYLPEDFLGYVFYPFYLLMGKFPCEGKALIADFRNVIMFVIFCGFMLFYGFIVIKNKTKICFDKKDIFLWVLWLSSYIIWLVMFSIQRYSIQFLMLSAIIMTQVATALYPKKGNVLLVIYGAFTIVILYALVSTPYYSDKWGKREKDAKYQLSILSGLWPELKNDEPYFNKFNKNTKYVEMEDIRLPDDTLLQMYGLPSGAILPILNQSSKVRGINFYTDMKSDDKVFFSKKWMDTKYKIVNEHKGFRAILIAIYENLNLIDIYYRIALKEGMECHLVINNIFDWLLCVPKEKVKEVFRWRYQQEKIK